jgi:glycerophosphoryl diester phosphodiesterase
MMANGLPPMYQNQFLAHSLGGYKGHKYLNAEDALENSIRCGYRYFEVDFMLTQDDEIVCTHGWNEKNCQKTGMEYREEFKHMTRELFLAQTVHGMKTMDAKRLYTYMQQYPDLYWELDLHTLPYEKSVHMTEKILEAFEHNENALDHCLVQVNSMEMYRGIDSVYHFKYYQYNVKNDIDRLDEFIAFCQENEICAMALKKVFATKEVIEKIRNAGLALLVFTVDNKKTAQELLSYGANTICTNFIDIDQDLPKKKKEEPKPVQSKRTLLQRVRSNLKAPHKIPGKIWKKITNRR